MHSQSPRRNAPYAVAEAVVARAIIMVDVLVADELMVARVGVVLLEEIWLWTHFHRLLWNEVAAWGRTRLLEGSPRRDLIARYGSTAALIAMRRSSS